MADEKKSAGLRPLGRARRPPSEEPSSPLWSERVSDRAGDASLEGGRLALPGGRKPAQWDGSSAGVAPSRPNHRTHLPHVEAGEVPQHVCFRLFDSLPREVRRQLTDRAGRGSKATAQGAWRRDLDAALDVGQGACWLRRPDIAVLVRDALLHFHEERYLLHEWVVMPNHVHVLFTPLVGTPLSSVVHSWKSFTSRRATRVLGREGRFWATDYFDRSIRNEEHFSATAEYIRANPVNAGLCTAPEEWRWSSAYQPSVRDARPVYVLSPASRPPQVIPRPPRPTMRFLHAS